MSLSAIIELWDGILYSTYNLLNIARMFPRRGLLSKNKKLKDKYKGKRCFIVMNGPSINNHDLSNLYNEIVFTSNFFYKSNLVKKIAPTYYCWADSTFFKDKENALLIINDIRKSCPGVNFILNYKGYDVIGSSEDVFYEYCKHIPNRFNVRSNMHGMTSNYMTVAFHAISAAIYMGFNHIYILGLDFEPGAFTHFDDLGEDAKCENPSQMVERLKVCDNYWQYTKAQYEAFYLNTLAQKKGVSVINLNPKSCIRAFEFGNYENLFH